MNTKNSFFSGLDKEFVSRIIFHSAIVSVVLGGASFLLADRLPSRFGPSFLLGALCGIANLYLLKRAIEALVKPTGKRWLIAILSVLGLHVVVIGFLLAVRTPTLNPIALCIGFSVFLAVTVLKAAGSAFNPKGE